MWWSEVTWFVFYGQCSILQTVILKTVLWYRQSLRYIFCISMMFFDLSIEYAYFQILFFSSYPLLSPNYVLRWFSLPILWFREVHKQGPSCLFLDFFALNLRVGMLVKTWSWISRIDSWDQYLLSFKISKFYGACNLHFKKSALFCFWSSIYRPDRCIILLQFSTFLWLSEEIGGWKIFKNLIARGRGNKSWGWKNHCYWQHQFGDILPKNAK